MVKALRRWLEANELLSIVTGVLAVLVLLSMLLVFGGYLIVKPWDGLRHRGRENNLTLPIADPARFAGPGLDATIERLRFERIALLMRRSEIGGGKPFIAQNMRYTNFGVRDAFLAGLCAIGSLAPRLQPERDELGWRAKRLWRKHRGGEVETEKMLGTIFLANSNATPCHEHGASRDDKSLQDHYGPPEMRATNRQHRLI
jgi:hypothetical protein